MCKSENRASIILALIYLRRKDIFLTMFSPEWQQEALGVLLGKGRWVLQEINLEQCLPETSLKAADGISNREFDTSKRADISVLGC